MTESLIVFSWLHIMHSIKSCYDISDALKKWLNDVSGHIGHPKET